MIEEIDSRGYIIFKKLSFNVEFYIDIIYNIRKVVGGFFFEKGHIFERHHSWIDFFDRV